MYNLEKNPMKLYIQDIFRAKQNAENKYCYELFDLSFKNIMIHGVVTFLVNNNGKINFEISDPTGCIEVYYDSNKNGINISHVNFNHLVRSFANVSSGMDENVITMSSLLNSIEDKYKNPLSFQEGSFLSVIGDVFVEDVKNIRMVSAYSCKESCATNDILWLEELRTSCYSKQYTGLKTQVSHSTLEYLEISVKQLHSKALTLLWDMDTNQMCLIIPS